MLDSLEQDVATSVALLDSLPADARARWLPQLDRRTYHYSLGPGETEGDLVGQRAHEVTRLIAEAIHAKQPLRANTVSTSPERFQVHLQLSDGEPLTVEVMPAPLPVAQWLPVVLVAQVVL